uniref:Uncharacterized protein n=1 Tax=viral metagenome TaxID=1070528 RepID=A0A6C0AU72_9ZZZZ
MSEAIGKSTFVPTREEDGTLGACPQYPPYPTWLVRACFNMPIEDDMMYLLACQQRVVNDDEEPERGDDGRVAAHYDPARAYNPEYNAVAEGVLLCAVYGHLPAMKRSLHNAALGRVLSSPSFITRKKTFLVNQAFQLACRHGQMHIVRHLMEHHGDILDTHTNHDGGFQEACEQRQVEIVRMLLQQTGKHAVPRKVVLRPQNAHAVRDALLKDVPATAPQAAPQEEADVTQDMLTAAESALDVARAVLSGLRAEQN